MKRFATAALAALLLWALVPAVGEFFENALHFVQEGHAAHAVPDGDRHDPTGPEHGCTGVVHLCSCCVSLSYLPTPLTAVTRVPDTGELLAVVPALVPSVSGRGVYHPPRV